MYKNTERNFEVRKLPLLIKTKISLNYALCFSFFLKINTEKEISYLKWPCYILYFWIKVHLQPPKLSSHQLELLTFA